MNATVANWHDFPMGPALRQYLGIDDAEYQGEQTKEPASEERAADFERFLLQYVKDQPIASYNEWANLLEEFNAMGFARLVVFLAEEDYREEAQDDYRALLAIGSSMMLLENWQHALHFLQRANQIEAEEIAAYTNIAGIYYSQEEDEKAQAWIQAGLDVDPNHQRLWELLASILMQAHPESYKEQLKQIALEKNSYLGMSLAADLLEEQDPLLKAQMLEEIYHRGIRDSDFLIEYTAALGLAKQYEKIPSIVFQAEKDTQEAPNWRLHVHATQAYLAQEQLELAEQCLQRLEKHVPETPQHVINELKQSLNP